MPKHSSLSPAGKAALPYWGIIELAAEVHATTADMWSWIRDSAEELGLASPGVTVQGVSELRGRAGQIQARAQAFARLADHKRVTADHFSTPPWQRDAGQRKAEPRWAVRYQHTFEQGGVIKTEWRTSMFAGRLNHTARQVRDLVELDAENLARKYRTNHIGTSDHQVMVV